MGEVDNDLWNDFLDEIDENNDGEVIKYLLFFIKYIFIKKLKDIETRIYKFLDLH